MGLEEIVARIEKETELKVKKTLDDAGLKSNSIIEDAKKQAQKYTLEKISAAKEAADTALSKASSKANVEGAQIYQKALNNSIESAIGEIRKQIASYTESDDYKRLLARLSESASKELGEGCIIMMRKQDMEMIKPIHGASIQQAKEAFEGGIIAYSSDGKRSMDYRLGRILDSIKGKVAVEVLKKVK
jgi:vacuolar-type H+-ATPase subunit E/Vma4